MPKPSLFDKYNFPGMDDTNDLSPMGQNNQPTQQGLTRPAMVADQPKKEPGIFGKIGDVLKKVAPIALPALAGAAGGVGLLPGLAAGTIGQENRDVQANQRNVQNNFKNSELARQTEHDQSEAAMKKMHEDNEKSSKDYQNQIASIMAGLKGKEVNIEGKKADIQAANTQSEIAHRDKPTLADYGRMVGNKFIGNPNDAPAPVTPGSSDVHPILPGEKYSDYIKRVSP